MNNVVGFDVFGTLCDPTHLASAFAPWSAHPLSIIQRWRQLQVEYVLRRSAMNRYVDFDRLTAQALTMTLAEARIYITTTDQQALCQQWATLPLHPHAYTVLQQLKEHQWHCYVWSNATPTTLQTFCRKHDIAHLLDGIVSIDEIRRYKPHPDVYHYFAQKTAQRREHCWLISQNSWDALGAVHAGLHAILVRDTQHPAETWEIAPDVTVPDLATAALYLIQQVPHPTDNTSSN